MKFKQFFNLTLKSNHVQQARWTLRTLMGVLPILLGLSKFLPILTDWTKYVSPIFTGLIPATTLLAIAGTIEILAGIMIFTKATRVGAYILTLWLLLVAVSMWGNGFYDIALLDLALAITAYATAKLWATETA